jgi:hypothetical protein
MSSSFSFSPLWARDGIVRITGIRLRNVFNNAFCGTSVVANIILHFDLYHLLLSPTK